MTYPGGVTVQARTRGTCAASRWAASSAAIAAGARRSDAREAERRGRRPVAELGARRALDHDLERGVHAEGVERTPHGLDEQRPGVSHIAQG